MKLYLFLALTFPLTSFCSDKNLIKIIKVDPQQPKSTENNIDEFKLQSPLIDNWKDWDKDVPSISSKFDSPDTGSESDSDSNKKDPKVILARRVAKIKILVNTTLSKLKFTSDTDSSVGTINKHRNTLRVYKNRLKNIKDRLKTHDQKTKQTINKIISHIEVYTDNLQNNC